MAIAGVSNCGSLDAFWSAAPIVPLTVVGVGYGKHSWSSQSTEFLAKYTSNLVLFPFPFSEPVVKKNTWVSANPNDDHSYAAPKQAERSTSEDLYLDDIQTDEDKLNSSLLSSESTFMPVASGLSPMSPTTDELRLHEIGIDVDSIIGKANADCKKKDDQDNIFILGEGATKSVDVVETQMNDQERDSLSTSSLSASAVVPPAAGHSNCQASSESHLECNDLEQSCTSEENLIKTVSLAKSVEEQCPCASVSLTQNEELLEEMKRAATKLQACWRGVYVRKHHPRAKEVRYEIRLSRMQEHIVHLTEEVEQYVCSHSHNESNN